MAGRCFGPINRPKYNADGGLEIWIGFFYGLNPRAGDYIYNKADGKFLKLIGTPSRTDWKAIPASAEEQAELSRKELQ